MTLRSTLLFKLSRRLMKPPPERQVEYSTYADWRTSSLTKSWRHFDDSWVRGRDVLDFACGDGPLSLYFAEEKGARTVTGVDLKGEALDRARRQLEEARIPEGCTVRFLEGEPEKIPLGDASVDAVTAFDCFEHVMSPGPILHEWMRVLRPGGRVLLEWYPFDGPWGPHMEALIPIPWAHVLFGEHAMFETAERIYDLPEFTPRHWDLDEEGKKKPNKWRQWRSFAAQIYVNALSEKRFRRLVREAGFDLARYERHSFSGPLWRRAIGRTLLSLPLIGRYFISYTVIELEKPGGSPSKATDAA